MQHPRKTLSIRPMADVAPGNSPEEGETLLSQAIQLRMGISATYNRAAFILAPHILYTRHGELFTDAMVVACDGKPPREPKLGTFKLSGLSGVALTGERFEPSPMFEALDPKYAENIVRIIRG